MREPEAGGHHQKAERQGEIVAAIELCGAHCRVQWRRDLLRFKSAVGIEAAAPPGQASGGGTRVFQDLTLPH
jgi:hypothetical protein